MMCVRSVVISTILLLGMMVGMDVARGQELLAPAKGGVAGPSTRWVSEPAREWSVAGEKPGDTPNGFVAESGEWVVASNATSPSRGLVISMSKRDAKEPFNVLLTADGVYRNVDVSVRLEPMSGQEDQGGGIVVRARDRANYYVVRWNPLEGDVGFYKVINGQREQISGGVAKPAGKWPKLRVVAEGSRFWAWLDDELVIDAMDETLAGSGRVGLWSKADAATEFDGFRAAKFAPPDTRADQAKVLFVGFHDRAVDAMAEASAEVDLPVRLTTIGDSDTPGNAQEQFANLDFAKYDVVYVLHILETESHALVGKFREAKKANPKLRIVMLDARPAADQELLDAGLMEIDPQVVAYWQGHSPENLKRLLGYTKVKFLGEKGEVRPPLAALKQGFYHPEAGRTFGTWAEFDAWQKTRAFYKSDQQTAALIVQQDYILLDNHAVYDAVVKELEGRGIRVMAIFGPSGGLQELLRECRPNIMMLQHHSGPEDLGEGGKKPFLEELGIPYLFCSGMVGSLNVEDWQSDVRGVKRGRWYGEMARHELFGIIEPFLVGMRGSTAYGFSLDAPVPERVTRFADRVEGWLKLQRTPPSEKKLAVVYFHHTLGKQDVGRPAQEMSRYLDPIASLVNFLGELKKAGYSVEKPPATSEELIALMQKSGRNVANWAPGDLDQLVKEGDPVLIPLEQYLGWYNTKLSAANRAFVEKSHGPPPGSLMTIEREGKKYIVLPVIRMGNVVLAPQPDRGNVQDQALIHSRTTPPPHNYLAFYWWLQEEFKADAVVHFGTHGTEMYLPGKEIFLSGEDFPDIILGKMPNFDVWTVTNVGEGLISKRRSYAVIVDHLTPPILPTARDAEAKKLVDLIDRLQKTPAGPVHEEILGELNGAVKRSAIAAEAGVVIGDSGGVTDEQLGTLSAHLAHLDAQTYEQGMHVLGKAPAPERAVAFVTQIVARNTGLLKKIGGADEKEAEGRGRVFFSGLLVEHLPEGEAAKKAGIGADVDLKAEAALGRKAFEGLNGAGAEIGNLLVGLSGHFVPTGPGGDPISRPDSLPTGRNLYGLSPAEIPSKQAYALAEKLTNEFLADFQKKNGRMPVQLALTMTGMETFRDMGVMEGQILALLGVRPVWNPGGVVVDLQLIPRAELGRARVDVVMSVNAIYLKNFPQCVRLLQEAVRLASNADEPDNAVRQGSAAVRTFLLSKGSTAARAEELSTARAFGGAPGDNTARLIFLLPRSGTWQGQGDLLALWRDTRTNVYTDENWGENMRDLHDKVYSRTEAILSNWSDNILGPLTNHHWTEETGGLALSVDALSGKKIPVTVFDLRRQGAPAAMSLEETLALEMRALALNKDWIQGQMEHGYVGATQFMQVTDNAFRWNAVRTHAIWNGAFDELTNVYVRDSLGLGMKGFFEQKNPYALQQLTATLLEAARKGYWTTDEKTVRELATVYAESVAKHGTDGGPYTGGNLGLRQFVNAALGRAADGNLKQAYLAKMEASETGSASAGALASAGSVVSGQRMVEAATRPSEGAASQPAMEKAMEKALEKPGDERWVYYLAGAAVVVVLAVGFKLKVGLPR